MDPLKRIKIAAHHVGGGHPSAAAMSAAAAAGHHHHGGHAASSHLHDKGGAAEYILPTSADMNCNGNADLAAAAAAASAVTPSRARSVTAALASINFSKLLRYGEIMDDAIPSVRPARERE